ncbi:MAG: hypothetical protein LBB83_05185 [Treponema sp.]|jgi:hypothetical protein|nr:hypothetical protein [Treponema sp.]
MLAITQQMTGTTLEWESADPLLYEGVIGIENLPDGGRHLKIGNGQDRWQALPYVDASYLKGLPETLQGIDAALTGAIQGEAAAREQADSAEAAARAAGDAALGQQLQKVAVKTDENHYAFKYLVQFITARLGPLNPVKMITESGNTLITEAGTRLIA